MEKENDFRSSVIEKGRVINQIVIFSRGNKKTFKDVRADTIVQGEFTQFDLVDGRRIYINTKNVDWFEIISKEIEVEE